MPRLVHKTAKTHRVSPLTDPLQAASRLSQDAPAFMVDSVLLTRKRTHPVRARRYNDHLGAFLAVLEYVAWFQRNRLDQQGHMDEAHVSARGLDPKSFPRFASHPDLCVGFEKSRIFVFRTGTASHVCLHRCLHHPLCSRSQTGVFADLFAVLQAIPIHAIGSARDPVAVMHGIHIGPFPNVAAGMAFDPMALAGAGRRGTLRCCCGFSICRSCDSAGNRSPLPDALPSTHPPDQVTVSSDRGRGFHIWHPGWSSTSSQHPESGSPVHVV